MDHDRIPEAARDRFEPVRQVYEGSRWIVFEAVDRGLGRVVALKVARAPGRPSALRREALRRAMIAQVRLDHPLVLAVHEFHDEAAAPTGGAVAPGEIAAGPAPLWCVLPWVPGEAPTLEHRMTAAGADERRPTMAERLRIFRQVATALEFAHEGSLAHGRLRMQDVYLGPDDQVRVGGWAWRGEEPDPPEVASMTPETSQLTAAARHHDLAHLGRMLLELVTGEPHVRGHAGDDVLHDPPIPPRVPDDLALVIRRATASDADQRFPDVSAMIAALDVTAEAPRRPSPSRRMVVGTVPARPSTRVLLVLGVLGGAALLQSMFQDLRRQVATTRREAIDATQRARIEADLRAMTEDSESHAERALRDSRELLARVYAERSRVAHERRQLDAARHYGIKAQLTHPPGSTFPDPRMELILAQIGSGSSLRGTLRLPGPGGRDPAALDLHLAAGGRVVACVDPVSGTWVYESETAQVLASDDRVVSGPLALHPAGRALATPQGLVILDGSPRGPGSGALPPGTIRVACHPTGGWIVGAGPEGRLWLRDTGGGSRDLEPVPPGAGGGGGPPAVLALALAPRDQGVAGVLGISRPEAAPVPVLVLWDDQGRILDRTVLPALPAGIAFGEDGSELAVLWSPVDPGASGGDLRVEWRSLPSSGVVARIVVLGHDPETPDRRGRSPPVARRGEGAAPPGGPGAACALGPDGRLAVRARGDGSVEVFGARTGELLEVLEGHGAPVVRLAFDPDGTHLATASLDGTIRTWSVRSRREGQGFQAARALGDLDLSPDGSLLAVLEPGYGVRAWVIPGEEPVLDLIRPTAQRLVLLAGSGRLAVVTTGPHRLELHPLGRLDRPPVVVDLAGPVTAMRASPDGTRLAVAAPDLAVLSAETGQVQVTLPGSDERFRALAFSPNTRVLAVGGERGTVLVWDLQRTHLLGRLPAVYRSISSLDFIGEGRLLVAGDPAPVPVPSRAPSPGSRPEPGEEPGEGLVPGGSPGPGLSPAWIPPEAGALALWDLLGPGRPRTLSPVRMASEPVASLDGRIIVATDPEGRLRCWGRDGKPLTVGLPVGTDRPCHLALDGGGRHLALGFAGGHVELLDIGWFADPRTSLAAFEARTPFVLEGMDRVRAEGSRRAAPQPDPGAEPGSGPGAGAGAGAGAWAGPAPWDAGLPAARGF